MRRHHVCPDTRARARHRAARLRQESQFSSVVSVSRPSSRRQNNQNKLTSMSLRRASFSHNFNLPSCTGFHEKAFKLKNEIHFILVGCALGSGFHADWVWWSRFRSNLAQKGWNVAIWLSKSLCFHA